MTDAIRTTPLPLTTAPVAALAAPVAVTPKAPVRPRIGSDALQLSPAALAAREQARATWTHELPPEVADGSFRRVERDPRAPNVYSSLEGIDRGLEISAIAKAKGLPEPTSAERNKLAEATTWSVRAKALGLAAKPAQDQAIAKWRDSIREMKLWHVEEAIGADPVALMALKSLVLTGALDKAATKAADGRGLLEILDGLTKAKLPAGYDRQALVADLVIELADPAAIAQQFRSTCTVTSVQIMTARAWPAEYARLVSDLGTRGTAQTAGGAVLTRCNAKPDSGFRTQSSALFQAAAMDLGNGDYVYKDSDDQSGEIKIQDKVYPSRGLGPEEAIRVMDALTGGTWGYHDVAKDGMDAALKRLEALTKKGLTSPGAFTWADDLTAKGAMMSGHAILLTGVKDGRVYYTNPHGAEESMDFAAFQARARGVFFDARDPK